MVLRLLKKDKLGHRTTLMWYCHAHFLCEYAFISLKELQYRGKHYPEVFDAVHEVSLNFRDTGPPMWWGQGEYHNPPPQKNWPRLTEAEILDHLLKNRKKIVR